MEGGASSDWVDRILESEAELVRLKEGGRCELCGVVRR